jgi:hypothetical protein
VFHDDVQYTKQDWRNRNKLKLRDGLHWLTVPVKAHGVETAIDQVEIAGYGWIREHERMIHESLGRAPYYCEAQKLWWAVQDRYRHLSEMNQSLIKGISEYLGLKTQFINARNLGLTGRKTDKILGIVKAIGGTTYLSGPAAQDYLDVEKLNDAGIKVEWMQYRNEPYPQQYEGFEPTVSVLDTIANIGGLTHARRAA